ncbi:MAG: galactokinase family protein [Spirochaetia bacterium]
MEALQRGRATKALESLYGVKPGIADRQKARYLGLLDRFADAFPRAEGPRLFSTPGRTEICGNHTDHNGGRVLAAAVDLDAVAVASPTSDGRITIESEGYPLQEIRIDDLARRDSELGTATALTRGVAARMRDTGNAVGGFCASVTSDVLKGSGLSSSASYEVLIGTIINHLSNGGRIGGIDIALIAQFSENEYFGKPCGLMDQVTCALGGFVTIDFQDFSRPQVRAVHSDFSASGYVPVIVDTGGSHADLTDEYAAVQKEMKDVSRYFGGKVLRDISRERVLAELPLLRGKVSDRAILRALHFYADDMRVEAEVQALENGMFADFLRLVRGSGRSSWMLLQNCYSTRFVEQQGVPIALSLSEILLGENGAWRVHGGGFAGTILAFVPDAKLGEYLSAMSAVFGAAACHALCMRAAGAVMLDVS